MIYTDNFEIALINTDGLWYGLLTRKSDRWSYETLGYEDREQAKRISKLLCALAEDEPKDN